MSGAHFSYYLFFLRQRLVVLRIQYLSRTPAKMKLSTY